MKYVFLIVVWLICLVFQALTFALVAATLGFVLIVMDASDVFAPLVIAGDLTAKVLR